MINRNVLFRTLMLFTLSLLSFSAMAEWDKVSKRHFKKNVKKEVASDFAAIYIDKLTKKYDLNMFIMEIGEYRYIIYSPEENLSGSFDDYIGTSYEKHIWVKLKGNKVLEVGSSFLLSKDQKENPKIIQQEVFYFSGKDNGKAFIANW